MRRYYTILICALSWCANQKITAQDLVIYEFASPADVTRAKFVQLLNTSQGALDVSGYQLKTFFNGNTEPGLTPFTFPSGTVLPPEGLYTLSQTNKIFEEAYGCGSDSTSTSIVANGNDVYAVFNGSGQLIDRYGVFGENGEGKDWEFNGSVVRRSVLIPNYGDFDLADFKITKPGNVADAAPCLDTLVPLPVTLLSFAGHRVGQDIVLDWSTAQEIDNDHFAVERSDDSVEYTELVRVPAGDPGGQAYSHTYRNPGVGTHYFRLRQVDLDGSTDTSTTVSVRVAGPDATGLDAQVVGDELIITQASARPNAVVASDGRVVARLEGYAGEARLSLGALPSGIYVLTDGETSLRFLRP